MLQHFLFYTHRWHEKLSCSRVIGHSFDWLILVITDHESCLISTSTLDIDFAAASLCESCSHRTFQMARLIGFVTKQLPSQSWKTSIDQLTIHKDGLGNTCIFRLAYPYSYTYRLRAVFHLVGQYIHWYISIMPSIPLFLTRWLVHNQCPFWEGWLGVPPCKRRRATMIITGYWSLQATVDQLLIIHQ